MGCAQSRDEARKAAFGQDFNTVPYAFKAADNKLDIAHFLVRNSLLIIHKVLCDGNHHGGMFNLKNEQI